MVFLFSLELMLGQSSDPPDHLVLKPSLSAYSGFTLFPLSPDTQHLESILIQTIQSLCTEVTSSAVIFLCN